MIVQKQTEIKLTVCRDIAFMLVYGYSDTLSSEEQQEFHDYMDRLKEWIPYDYIETGEIVTESDNWRYCEVLGLSCDAWVVPVTLVEVTL